MMLLERAPSCTRQRQQKVVSLLEMISLQMSVVCTRSESVALCPACPTWLNIYVLLKRQKGEGLGVVLCSLAIEFSAVHIVKDRARMQARFTRCGRFEI
jgi:hypothetical protein